MVFSLLSRNCSSALINCQSKPCLPTISKLLGSRIKWQPITWRRCLCDENVTGDERETEGKESEVDILLKDAKYQELVPRSLRGPGDGHNVLLIQPRVKWGPQKEKSLLHSTPLLQLEEAVALIETLENWTVVEKMIIPTTSLQRKRIFGTGKVEDLAKKVRSSRSFSAVVMGVNVLSGDQQALLEETFRVPIYDRYSIVLQIFRKHANSREAKLQVALAEIPYVKSRLKDMGKKGKDRANDGSGESYLGFRKQLLDQRGHRLLKEIEKLKTRRDDLRKKRSKMQIPVVAVVGYTNCGKTTLIKNLTKDENMEPKDHLFATLDVTVHSGRLSSLKQVLFVDTVGFISNIPTSLIEAFKATLREVILSDLVIHVRDVSHPDAVAQREAVVRTLSDIDLPEKLSSTIIELGNKVDKIRASEELPTDTDLLISATEGTNIDALKERIEEKVIQNTGRETRTLRVPMGGEEYQWLHKESTVCESLPDPEDNNYSLTRVVITSAALGRFKKYFNEDLIVDNFSKKYANKCL